ncbi:family 43 glycosylhydrolase [Dactylosporangium cerinum]|uniref:Family 43 glycosylhydrolase n=1 Tax=Dactylosporangium cerinum TaxID=1434730 RepID=A0ABV9WES4_9ACTN
MKRVLALLVALLVSALACFTPAPTALAATSGNPILPGDHPDPSIELFNGAYYVYTTASGGSTDAPGRYFHAWRSTDLTNWVDAGVVLDRATVTWASTDTRTWAPDMVYRNGKYYFYTAIATSVSVSVCDSPVGPCRDKGTPLVQGKLYNGIEAIDPMVFVDDDGQAYLYFGGSAGGGTMGIFRLNADMISVNGAVTVQRPQNFTEAPFVFKRAGRYYLQYSNGSYANNTYNVQYSTGPGPLGPWTYGGQILSAAGAYNGPGHNGLLQYPGTDDWYLVYHRYQNANYSTRYTALDRMYFNADGSIQRVTMTSAGVEARPAPAAGGLLTGPGGKCVDVNGDDSGVNGAAVQLWDCLASAADQHWTSTGGTLRTLGRCLDVTGGSVVNGALVQLWDCNGGGAQQWVPQTNGSLRNPASGRCLDSPNGAVTNGTRLRIWDCNGSAAQVFRLTTGTITGPGGKCVDVSGDDVGVNGAAVQLWDCLASAADQHWTPSGGTLRTLGRCLDVTGGSVVNGALVQLWDCNGGGAQQWVPQTNGSLRNPASGRCLDSPNGAVTNGTRLQIWDCNGSTAQVFRLT